MSRSDDELVRDALDHIDTLRRHLDHGRAFDLAIIRNTVEHDLPGFEKKIRNSLE